MFISGYATADWWWTDGTHNENSWRKKKKESWHSCEITSKFLPHLWKNEGLRASRCTLAVTTQLQKPTFHRGRWMHEVCPLLFLPVACMGKDYFPHDWVVIKSLPPGEDRLCWVFLCSPLLLLPLGRIHHGFQHLQEQFVHWYTAPGLNAVEGGQSPTGSLSEERQR